ncbi:MAG: hypothetical protein PHS14_00660 [Elusimicrobia bacterium]|nr:hypothetical protein [Elusimicrobiota bacterium]
MIELGIELHDSRIDELSVEDGDLLLTGVVYVREPEGPGRFHDAVIRVKDGECEREELEVPFLLDDGSLVLNGSRFDNVLPYPLEAEGETALLLAPAESSEFVIRGSGIEIKLVESAS